MKRGLVAIGKGFGVGLVLTVSALVWATIGTEAAHVRYNDETIVQYVAAALIVVPVVAAALSLTSSLARR